MRPEPIDPLWLAAITSIAAAAVPALAVGLGAVLGMRAWRKAPGIPAISIGLAVLAGLLIAAAAIAGGPLAPVLRLGDVLRPDSPWDIPGQSLVTERFPTALAGLSQALNTPLALLLEPVRSLVCVGLVTISAAIAMPLLTLPLPQCLGVVAKALLVAGVTVLAAVYVACFGPWLVNLLNFWALGVALALFCYWRHGTL
jgi:hypothetical protein